MQHIEKTVDVRAPVRAVYEQLTHFEELPSFLYGVKEVRRIDDTHLRWLAAIAGQDKRCEARITERVPDRVIAWRSSAGLSSSGAVRFEELAPERTRVLVSLDYEPEGGSDPSGQASGVLDTRVQRSLEQLRDLLEARSQESFPARGTGSGSSTRWEGGPDRPSDRHGRPGGQQSGSPPPVGL
jgi:uncharacterized membrane protein